MTTRSAPRLFVIPARDARVAVVFRRGPTAWTLLLKWNLKTDEVLRGQWINGRIYERRCDLSPSGGRLVYFVGKFGHPWKTWTAISQPPDFTAITLWQNGTAWGGGGFFENEQSLLIRQRETSPSVGFHLPQEIDISCFQGKKPLYQRQLESRGWIQVDDGEYRAGTSLTYEKTSRSQRLRVEAKLDDGRVNVYDVRRLDNQPLFRLSGAPWADWDKNGDLLFARNGRLFRLAARKLRDYPDKGDAVLKCVADLNGLQPDPQPATPKERRGRFR